MSVVANVAINIDGKQAQSLLKAIQGEVEKLNGSFQDLEPKPKTFGQKIKDFAQSAVGQLAAVTGAAFTLQQAFTTLSNQSRAEAALRTLGVDADDAAKRFAQLSKELQGQASTVELTAAAYDVASAGFVKAADQTSILEAATKGAVGGMSDINTVGNAVTSVLNAYGLSANQAAGLVDGFIQTQNDGKIILAEYAALIGRLAPTAAAAGVGIKELNAAVATITAQGVAPETAVTGLNQALVSILKPTAEASALSRELGIDFNEAGLRSKGLAGFLEQVATATGGSASKLTTLFGSVDALKAILPLLSGDMQKFVDNLLKQDKAAGVAEKAFKEMANTLEGALKEVDTAFKNLVVRFKPITPAVIAPFKVLANAINLVADNIKTLAQTAAFIGTFVGVLKGAAIATSLWATATQGLATAKKAAGVAAAFLQSVMNPLNIAKVAIALGVATGAAVALGKAMDESAVSAQNAKGKQGEIASETAKINDEINKQLQGLDQVPPKQAAQSEAAKQTLNVYQEQTRAIEAQVSALDRGASITSARYEAEKAINNLRAQELEREYQLAQTADQRLRIAIAIFQNQAQAAEIEYRQALASIELETVKVKLQQQSAELKLKQVEASGKLAILEAKSVEEETKKKEQLKEAVDAQKQVIAGAEETGKAQKEISEYQKQTAKAQYESKLLTARIAFESKATSKDIGLSQRDAVRLSGGLASSAAQASSLRVQMGGAAINAERAARAIQIIRGNQSTPTSGNFIKSHAASGGYVSRPTATMIGEAGGEYIVPENKAADFAANYLSGARGAGALMGSSSPAINIQTGPVMQQGGQNYVTIQDMEAGLQAVADTILNNSRSYSARRFAGVS